MRTIKEIAKEAKVSVGTIDRVIHNRGKVAVKTEKKIKSLIEKYGYQPNLIAQSLVLKKTYTIVSLLPEYKNDKYEKTSFWVKPPKGLKKAAKELFPFGVKLEEYYFNQKNSISYIFNLEKILKRNDIDGIIMVPFFQKETEEFKEKLTNKKTPIIFLNIDLEGFDNIPFVGQDSINSGYLSGKLFHSFQSKNSTLLCIEDKETMNNHFAISKRLNGFYKYFEENKNLLKIKTHIINNIKNEKKIHQIFQNTLIKNDLKGVFVPSNDLAFIANYLQKNKIKLDLVVGYDLTENNIELLKKGYVSFLLYQEPINQSYSSMKIMFDYLVKKIPIKNKYFSPIHIIVKENVDYYFQTY